MRPPSCSKRRRVLVALCGVAVGCTPPSRQQHSGGAAVEFNFPLTALAITGSAKGRYTTAFAFPTRSDTVLRLSICHREEGSRVHLCSCRPEAAFGECRVPIQGQVVGDPNVVVRITDPAFIDLLLIGSVRVVRRYVIAMPNVVVQEDSAMVRYVGAPQRR